MLELRHGVAHRGTGRDRADRRPRGKGILASAADRRAKVTAARQANPTATHKPSSPTSAPGISKRRGFAMLKPSYPLQSLLKIVCDRCGALHKDQSSRSACRGTSSVETEPSSRTEIVAWVWRSACCASPWVASPRNGSAGASGCRRLCCCSPPASCSDRAFRSSNPGRQFGPELASDRRPRGGDRRVRGRPDP